MSRGGRAAKRKQSGPRVNLSLVVGAYAIALLLAYSYFVAPTWSYLGYIDNGVAWLWRGWALLLCVLPVAWLPTGKPRASHIIVWLVYLLAYIPSQLVPYLTLSPPSRLILWSLTLVAAMWLLCVPTKRPIRTTISLVVSPELFWLALGTLFAVIVVGAYLLGARLNAGVFSIADVYTTRFQFRGQEASLPGLGYVVYWGANVVNPFLIGFGLVRRRWFLLSAGIVGQLLLFSLTGVKETLFSPIFIALLILALSPKRSARLGRSLTLMMLTLIALAAFLSHFGNTILMFLFVRRTMGTPGLLSAYYFDFFSRNAPTLFSHNVLKLVLTNPYPEGPPFLIGRVYFNSPVMSANASLFADGFAGFRYVGVLLEAALASLFLRLLDEAASGRDLRLLAAPLGLTGLGLVETGISTALLTDGMLLTFFLILLMPREFDPPTGTARRRERLAQSTADPRASPFRQIVVHG